LYLISNRYWNSLSHICGHFSSNYNTISTYFFSAIGRLNGFCIAEENPTFAPPPSKTKMAAALLTLRFWS